VLDTIISARLAGVTRAAAAESLVWTLPGQAVID
jgi:hypothetical protein